MLFSEIRKIVTPLMTEMMRDLGFKKAKYEYFIEIGKNYRISVDFNEVGQRAEVYYVIPFVNVRNKKADAILLELIPDLPFRPIHGLSLGDVTDKKKYRAWVFYPDDNYSEIVNDIRCNLVQYGIPYLESVMANPMLHIDYCKDHESAPYEFYFLPVLYYVAGDIDECKSYLDRYATEYYDKKSSEIEMYRKIINLDYLEFRDKLLQYIEDHKED